jgi:hypothetical protein
MDIRVIRYDVNEINILDNNAIFVVEKALQKSRAIVRRFRCIKKYRNTQSTAVLSPMRIFFL